MLVKLAKTHDSGLVERKEKEEKVLGATTWKKAGALAREEDAGGFSVLSDNAGKVYKYILHFCPPYFCNRVNIANTMTPTRKAKVSPVHTIVGSGQLSGIHPFEVI